MIPYLVVKSFSSDDQGESERFTPVHSLQRPSNGIEETDIDEGREGAPVVISRFPSTTIEISHVFWICFLFFLLCSLTVLLLWIGLAFLYVTYMVVRKFGMLHPQLSPFEVSETETPSSRV